MKIVAVIQARMGSTRLPGKVLLPVGGRSILARVCRRTCRAELVDQVVVATSVNPLDDPIAAECQQLGLPCFRGSEEDVLDRYWWASQAYEADAVVRITADCPLIDPHLIDDVVQDGLLYWPDYAANVLQRTYPRGLDTEFATAGAMERAWNEAREPYQRAHVMPYFYQNPQSFRLCSITGSEDHSQHRWTVDSPEDLAFVRAVYDRMDNDDGFAWTEALDLLAVEPELCEFNRHVRQKHLVEG